MIPLEIDQVMGFSGYALALAAAAAALVGKLTARLAWRRLWTAAAALIAALLTTGLRTEGIPLGGFLRGTVGDLSVTTMLMLAAALSATLTGRSALDARSRTALFAWAAVAGTAMYPLTLRLSRLDPYELGYRPRALLALVAALIIAWWWRRRGAAVVLAAGVGAFNLGVLESANLWDYLLDPALVASAWGVLLWRAARMLAERASRRAPSAPPGPARAPGQPPPPAPRSERVAPAPRRPDS